jgi:hypothetical protein
LYVLKYYCKHTSARARARIHTHADTRTHECGHPPPPHTHPRTFTSFQRIISALFIRPLFGYHENEEILFKFSLDSLTIIALYLKRISYKRISYFEEKKPLYIPTVYNPSGFYVTIFVKHQYLKSNLKI